MASNKSGGNSSRNNRHVVPNGNGWAVKQPGVVTPTSKHHTQGAAEAAAKKQTEKAGGGEVTIHRPNGKIRDRDTVAPGNDPSPPRDEKH